MNRLTRLLVLGSFVTMLGCSRYPEVTSPEAQKFHSTSLHRMQYSRC